MKKYDIKRWEVEALIPEVCDGEKQTRYTEDEAVARQLMQAVYESFLASLRARKDVSNLEVIPKGGGVDYKVVYWTPAPTGGFYCRKAYFGVFPSNIEYSILEEGDQSLFEL